MFWPLILLLCTPAAVAAQCDHEPLSILQIGQYYDGGSYGVAVTDSSGCRVEMCFDFSLGTSTPGRIRLGTRYPSSPLGHLADPQEAQRAVDLLQAIADHHCPRDLQPGLAAIDSYRDVAFTERDVWQLLRLIKGHHVRAADPAKPRTDGYFVSELGRHERLTVFLESRGCFHWLVYEIILEGPVPLGVTVNEVVNDYLGRPIGELRSGTVRIDAAEAGELDKLLKFYRSRPAGNCTTKDAVTLMWDKAGPGLGGKEGPYFNAVYKEQEVARVTMRELIARCLD